jgi:hypothetical protein
LSLSQALTWVQPHVAQPVLLCAQNTVRQLCGLQQGKVQNSSLKAHTQFVQQAFGAAGQSVDSLRPAVTRFQECLPRLWRIPWDNRCKEALWRLAVNGLPGCMVARAVPCLCALHCGSATQQTFAHRQHAFWDCLFTVEVRRQLALALPIGFQLSQHHLWLVKAPPGIMQAVWDVVAIFAVHAVFAGQKHMWSRSFAGAEDPQVREQAGCARAKSAFWHMNSHPCCIRKMFNNVQPSQGNITSCILQDRSAGNNRCYCGGYTTERSFWRLRCIPQLRTKSLICGAVERSPISSSHSRQSTLTGLVRPAQCTWSPERQRRWLPPFGAAIFRQGSLAAIISPVTDIGDTV